MQKKLFSPASSFSVIIFLYGFALGADPPYRFLDELPMAEVREFSEFNLSPLFAEIIKENGIIIDEEIDHRAFRYTNDSNRDGSSEHWAYKPKYKMWIPDTLHPPKEMSVKKDGVKLKYQHFLIKPKTPINRWDVDENFIYVTVPDRDGRYPPEGKYTVTYISYIKEDHERLNYRYSQGLPYEFFRKYINIENDTREALFLPAPSEISFDAIIRTGGVLRFSVGLMPGYWYSDSDGAIFEIYIKEGSKDYRLKAFEKDIDPRDPAKHKWFDYTIDMKDYEGKGVKITFRTREKGDKTFDYCAFANPEIFYKREDLEAVRNVILISIDTLRADHLGCYGYDRNTTPFMDKLSKESVIFKRCLVQAPWTLPSHMSIFTSMITSEHGVWDRNVILDRKNITLPMVLHREGYTTKAFVTHKFLSPLYGFHKGFESYVYHQDEKAHTVTKNALKWISANKESPFFLFLHYFDPHFDYKPPPPYNKFFDPYYRGEIVGSLGYLYKYSDPRNKINPADLNHLISLYDGEILYTDKGIEYLIRGLQAQNLLERTMIIITSDHGEEFKDHDSMLHGTTLFEEQLRVPLVMRLPSKVHKIVEEQVESVDIAPTILSFLGVPRISAFKGQSLMPLIKGDEDNGGVYQVVPAFSETKRFGPYRVAVTTPEEKFYCTFMGLSNDLRYYNLLNDPQEKENLFLPQYERAEALRNLLALEVPNYSVERKWILQYFTTSKDDVFEIRISGTSRLKILKTENLSEPNDRVVQTDQKISIVSKRLDSMKKIIFEPEEFISDITIDLLINNIRDEKRVRIGGITKLSHQLPIKIRHDLIKDHRYNIRPDSNTLPEGGFLLWCESHLRFTLSPAGDEKIRRIILNGDSIKLLKSLGYIQ